MLYPLSYEGGVWLKPLLEASLKLRLRVRAGARVAHRSPRDDVEAVERPAAFYATMKPVSAWLRIRSQVGLASCTAWDGLGLERRAVPWTCPAMAAGTRPVEDQKAALPCRPSPLRRRPAR